jgi:spore maturation protein CgeB
MRFLLVDGDYPELIRLLYSQNSSLKKQPFERQLQFRNECLYGMADFYSSNLIKLGHEAYDLFANNEVLQRTWAREHKIYPGPCWRLRFGLRRHLVPWLRRVRDRGWMYKVLGEQIKYYKPDVMVALGMTFLEPAFLQEMKKHVRLMIGWGSPPVLARKRSPEVYSRAYDLVVAPAEGMVDYFNSCGMKAELLRHAFEPRILSKIDVGVQQTFPISFAGLLRGEYSKRRELLETLCAKMGEQVFIWASSCDGVPLDSPIHKRFQGAAWGQDYYQVLALSKIAWNCHLEIAGQFADNLRLFEATGTATLLVTDWKENLHKVFNVGQEIVAYRTIDECVELIRHYLDHDDERNAVRQAGQRRTLREHTYRHRAEELVDIVRKHL